MASIKDDDCFEYFEAVERLRAKVKTLNGSVVHICNPSYCSPVKDDYACNLFLCKYGTIHLCTKEKCENYRSSDTFTCPISGIRWVDDNEQIVSSYNKTDPRTWKSKGQNDIAATTKPKKKKHKPLYKDAVKDEIQKTIVHLLFGPKRVKCNEDERKKREQEAIDACATYRNQQKERFNKPFVTDLARITSIFTHKEPLFQIFELDKQIIDYYVHVVFQVYEKVIKFSVPLKDKKYDETGEEIPPRVDLKIVTLGVLYSMRKGLSLSNTDIVFLPKDDFILLHLPQIDSLSAFGIEKKEATNGIKLISATYENARNMPNVSLPSLCLNMDELPARDNLHTLKKN
jgi:hypothetical protein